MLLSEVADDYFDEIVNCLCKGKAPKGVDYLFFYRLNKRSIAKTHSSSSAKLLTFMLEKGTDFSNSGDFFKNYLQENKDLPQKEREKLQEALLKRGFRC